jgi:hypothetical protein
LPRWAETGIGWHVSPFVVDQLVARASRRVTYWREDICW